MKKLISVALCLALMLTLAACGGSGSTKMTMRRTPPVQYRQWRR